MAEIRAETCPPSQSVPPSGGTPALDSANEVDRSRGGDRSSGVDRPGAHRSAGGSGAGGHDSARRWLILAVLGVAQLMVVLDATIVNIALPSAQNDLGFSDDARQWVVTAYANPP